jgi:hypothetical protein
MSSCVPACAEFNIPMHVQYNDRTYIDLDDEAHGIARPFYVEGARNVILDTVKRGEDDDFVSPGHSKTVVIRLYEAFGGQFDLRLDVTVLLLVHIWLWPRSLTDLLCWFSQVTLWPTSLRLSPVPFRLISRVHTLMERYEITLPGWYRRQLY